MTPKYLEKTKRNMSLALATACLLGCAGVWFFEADHSHPDLNMGGMILLMSSAAAFFGGMPGEFDDIREKKIWGIALYCALPFILAIFILKPWLVFAR